MTLIFWEELFMYEDTMCGITVENPRVDSDNVNRLWSKTNILLVSNQRAFFLQSLSSVFRIYFPSLILQLGCVHCVFRKIVPIIDITIRPSPMDKDHYS